MLFKYSIVAGLLLFASQSLPAAGDKTIEVKALSGSAIAAENTKKILPHLTDLVEVSDQVLGMAYHDEANLFLVLSSREKTLTRSLREIGLKLKFKGKKDQEFSIRLQPAEAMFGGPRPARIASGIEPLLPQYINNRLHDFMPPSDYSAYLIRENGRRGGQLIVPEFDALFQDSSATLVARIPFANPIYPAGLLPFEKEGKLKVEIEIGDEFFARSLMMGVSGLNPSGNRFPGNREHETPPFGYQKFETELLLAGWSAMPHRSSANVPDFNLSAYLDALDAWSAQSSLDGRSGWRGRGGQPGGGSGVPPISFHALFASDQIVKNGIEYVSTFLHLQDAEKQQAYDDFREQWQTDQYFPVLLTMRTNLHKSYLDLSRWTIFVEDDDRNQYEAMKVANVTDFGVRPPANAEEENRLARPIFAARMKRLVLLFPRESFSGKPIWDQKGRKMTLVVLSNEHPEQRLEAEWRVPK